MHIAIEWHRHSNFCGCNSNPESFCYENVTLFNWQTAIWRRLFGYFLCSRHEIHPKNKNKSLPNTAACFVPYRTVFICRLNCFGCSESISVAHSHSVGELCKAFSQSHRNITGELLCFVWYLSHVCLNHSAILKTKKVQFFSLFFSLLYR